MKTNTTRLKQLVKKSLQKGRLLYLARQDIARFSRHAALSAFDDDYEQVVARIMYNVHALEKGLARTRDRRLGFGRKALANLNDAMHLYRARGYDESGFAFVEGMSVIQRYLELHAAASFDIGFLAEVVDGTFRVPAAPGTFGAAGTKLVRRADKQGNAAADFYSLALGRSSVREFTGEPIDTAKVMAALQHATKTPSVCNRQSWRVYWTEDKALAGRVLEHQRGFGQPQLPEVLLAITASNNAFLSPVERNQGFIDGGLFSMSVLYGLEREGLAAVPLNACLYSRDQAAIRELLGIDPSEVIVMFIAVGDLPEETVVPISDRRPAESFVRRR